MSALYVHIPFCNHICTYCDFCKVFYKEEWVHQYLDALSFEIQDKRLTGNYETIYIGGGTPSSLSTSQLQRLFEILKPFSYNVKEYSVEVNPESMDADKLDLMIDYGINRLSIGVQTFQDKLLKGINRYHSSSQVIQLIQLAKSKGIDDISIDLIYGLPNQTKQDIIDDINQMDSLQISHVSIYSLILEEHTVLKNQNYHPLSDEEDAIIYHHINQLLKEKGFIHYEVSNYYKRKPSLHNLGYWHYEDYDGVGLGAHSLKNHHRFENTNSLTDYFDFQYLLNDIILLKKDELFETLMMGLRLCEGISLSRINEMFQIDFLEKYKFVIEKYKAMKFIEVKNNYLKTTSQGMDYLNTILIDFMEE